MNKNLITILLLIIPITVFAERYYNTDSLIAVLDDEITNSSNSNREIEKQKRITQYKYALSEASDDNTLFYTYQKLFFEYRKFKLDSALFYATERVNIATKLGNTDSMSSALMNKADGLKGLGLPTDALAVLNSIPRSEYTNHSPYFYHLYHSVTLSLSQMIYDPTTLKNMRLKLRHLRDTIDIINPKDGLAYTINHSEILKADGKFDEALKFMTDYMKNHPEEATSSASFLSGLSKVYKTLGNSIAEKYYLTAAAIQDKRSCGKTYTTIQDLAMLLYKEGDNERAYHYISHALQDIMSCNARSRLLQTSEYMPIIAEAYSVQQKNEAKNNKIFLIVIIAFSLSLIIVLFLLYKRNKKLNITRLLLKNKNNELSKMNNSLNNLNNQLLDSNKIKEEYIAQLFNICSTNIDYLEKYRISLSRKMKGGQYANVTTELEQSLSAKQLKDFFHNFDIIFLGLFPNFVSAFNSLLQPDATIVPKDGHLLTPELRIYALVRLGINDSIKIAEFLHYSPQTVYNYRLKVRNKLIIPKENFIETVQNL